MDDGWVNVTVNNAEMETAIRVQTPTKTVWITSHKFPQQKHETNPLSSTNLNSRAEWDFWLWYQETSKEKDNSNRRGHNNKLLFKNSLSNVYILRKAQMLKFVNSMLMSVRIWLAVVKLCRYPPPLLLYK